MKRIAIVVLFLCSVFHTAAFADDENRTSVSTSSQESTSILSKLGSVSANLGLTSDFVFRGQSLTNHNPAVQGGLDWNHPLGFYLGAWGSNVKLPDSPAMIEADMYGGWGFALNSDTTLSTGAIFYTHPNYSEGNTLEFPLLLSWKNTKTSLNYAPHWGGGDAGHSWYVNTGWSPKIRGNMTLNLNVGYSMFTPDLGINNYADFHAGLSREMLGLTFDLSGYFVNRQQMSGLDDPRAVLSMTKTL